MKRSMLVGVLLFVFATSAVSQAIELINKDFTGKRSAHTGVGSFVLGNDGRLVAFASTARNIAISATNRVIDIFVYDRWLRGNIWNTTHSRWLGANAMLPEGSQPLHS